MITSPFLLMKQLESHILRLLFEIDISELTTRQQHSLAILKNGLVDARLDIQDYELAETREDQVRNAQDARGRLDKIHAEIISNNLGVFSAVDVAHLSAQIGQISGKIK